MRTDDNFRTAKTAIPKMDQRMNSKHERPQSSKDSHSANVNQRLASKNLFKNANQPLTVAQNTHQKHSSINSVEKSHLNSVQVQSNPDNALKVEVRQEPKGTQSIGHLTDQLKSQQ